MAPEISRRSFIGSGAACVAATWLNGRASGSRLNLQSDGSTAPITLEAGMRTLEINGRPASVMGIRQPGGEQGLSRLVDQPFDVTLQNNLAVPTAIHWHGLHPPNKQDGVPGLTQPVVTSGASARYSFPTLPSGTHWMHSHQGLQGGLLLAAPLIVHDPADEPKDEQQIIFSLETSASLRRPRSMPNCVSLPPLRWR